MDTYVYVKLLLPPRQSRGVSPLTRAECGDRGIAWSERGKVLYEVRLEVCGAGM